MSLNWMVIRVFQGVISKELIDTVVATTADLVVKYPPLASKEGRNKRGDVARYHLGCWQNYAPEPYTTGETNNKHARDWLQQNQPLFERVSHLFKTHFPRMYDLYASVDMPEHLIGVFASLALNINFASTPHNDDKDFRSGLCWVMPFGNFKGGNLVFPDINIEVVLAPGDLICFQSFKLEHFNRNFEGVRNSIVFFTHHNMFFSAQK